ncbi:uncharacterized protein STEHIDRAFT_99669 [Stereum hirsutum FP-91666 SS1]|uniref:uncharacterized protein n=1 Tax=Stereum hirsutum (strain FP-91666) TaxID=721885 RepID=UPI0004449D4A|nr:uncharacterized protein STEHIDRAFT_99669 [Stereum hirsutum FP-91666 SS1]EIM84830.1 hypothetical protein STEHIDRAFT_99669 [Stereum hirsutum FP-91666 SS1]
MQNPADEIASVVKLVTTTPSPDVQKRALERYYTSDAGFRHPLCTVPSAHNSRESVIGIYQWYRIMSPKIELEVNSVSYDKEKGKVFLDVTQKFHIRFNPLPATPARLSVHLSLREENGLYYIALQEDFYHPDDLISLVIPILASPAHMALRAGAISSNIFARVFQVTFGWWQPSTGERVGSD